jgi:ABC-type nickel/cobalt efflux system permease component RcnA
MPVWGWIIVAIALVAMVGVAAWMLWTRQRTQRLQETFGPEYQRTVDSADDRRKAEAELEERRKRREQLTIRPLDPATRERYSKEWRDVQSRFVDSPSQSLRQADRLVTAVMRDRGYPMDDFQQRSADISVDHPQVVENYRAAHAVSLATEHDKASTEDIRQAMVHYRSLFEELVATEKRDKAQEG